MSDAHTPVMPQRWFRTTGTDDTPSGLVEAFIAPLAQTADRVAAAFLSGRLGEPHGVSFDRVTAIRITVAFDAPAPGRGFVLAPFFTVMRTNLRWLSLADAIDDNLKAHLKVPFEDLVETFHREKHAWNGANFEYAASMARLSHHETMRLHASLT